MSEELEDLSILDEMDIPEVVRDETPDFAAGTAKKSGFNTVLILAIGGLFLASFGAIAGWQMLVQRSLTATDPTTSTESPEQTTTESTDPPTAEANADQLLGHFAYEEAREEELTTVTADGRIRLRPSAAEKYQEMVNAARQEGIYLQLISGFRTIEEQQYLFFEVKEQRAQNATKRAEVSAPPRYSEHHTGYAIDVGDANVPATNLSQSFENTPAFRWLETNAARFSFELSFPRNNPQGIAYEPWHWRFVGDQDSLETFYKSRNFTDTATEFTETETSDIE